MTAQLDPLNEADTNHFDLQSVTISACKKYSGKHHLKVLNFLQTK